MHKVYLSILRSLRRAPLARYSELRGPTGLESDAFKFYLRKLVRNGLVCKRDDGRYELTVAGKEYANNLDRDTAAPQKQPKLSMQLVVPRMASDGTAEYLIQERLRHPFLHYLGLLSGPIRWGESVETTAGRELLKQTGLTATFDVRGICRTRDYARSSGDLLEDKLFMVLQAHSVSGALSNEWTGGHNAWMALDELARTPKHYDATFTILQAIERGQWYTELNHVYSSEDY